MISEREVNALIDIDPEAIRFYLYAMLLSGGSGCTGNSFEDMRFSKEKSIETFGDVFSEKDGKVYVEGKLGKSTKKTVSEAMLVDLIVNMFNASAPGKVPKVNRKTIVNGGKRHKQVVGRFRDMKSFYNLDNRQAAIAFGKFFEYCWSSKYLSNEVEKQEGRYQDHKVTFDMIMTPTYFPQICEGKYCKEPFNPQ